MQGGEGWNFCKNKMMTPRVFTRIIRNSKSSGISISFFMTRICAAGTCLAPLNKHGYLGNVALDFIYIVVEDPLLKTARSILLLSDGILYKYTLVFWKA